MKSKENLRSYSDMLQALDSVYLHKTLHNRSLLYLYDELPAPENVGEEGDCEMEVIVDALHSLSEAVWSHYSDYEDTNIMYFSHPAIMEYYQLCRVYGKRKGVKLGDNPFMRQAAENVRSCLYQEGCFTCSYYLQTKINHEWASGIVFRMSSEFTGSLALLVKMSQVFDFYERELITLKKEISEIEKPLSQNHQLREAA